MNMKKHIVFVGMYGVPYLRRAMDVRLAFFANLLAKKSKITIVNRYCFKDSKNEDIKLLEDIEVIELFKGRTNSSLLKLLFYFVWVVKEFFILYALNRRRKIDVLQVSSWHCFDFLCYKLIGLIISAKIVVQYVEYASAKPNRNIYSTINGYLSDKFGPILWDGAICISDFLKKHIETNFPKVKTIKIVPLCDFDFFDNITKAPVSSPFLLFCGSAAYFEIIRFVIQAYRQSKIHVSHRLVLVLSGSDKDINKVRDFASDIQIYTNLKYATLISYYKSSVALLIPLRDNIEDIARFPNKICEYLASKGLIITSANGEVLNYFHNENNALVASSYNIDSYARKMDWLVDNEKMIPLLKERAYILGRRFFDSCSYNDEINSFFQHFFPSEK